MKWLTCTPNVACSRFSKAGRQPKRSEWVNGADGANGAITTSVLQAALGGELMHLSPDV